ncbi:ead/Ea22-like family protein [Escherichia coli]|nr:ead/Ea22-like family protein [Escherichia coli]MED9479689.1 ead/Ea22-like family protein [Escherichia marmotae]MED9369953.1 ead/Ea22-like family protein [Escherichia coli]HBA9546087.1 ead/Ea22-like family protein [Escherichia coli]HBA9799695.1 ead/Ea22-like family protein [Escherichia coli]
MSNINYQALREIAKQATQGEWCAFISPGTGTYAVHTPGDKRCEDVIKWPGFDGQKNAENNARFIAAFNPVVVQALLDEREAQSKRIAELETNLAALAAENAGLNKFIAQSCYVFDGEQDELSDAYICVIDGRMPQIPATDAFLADVRAVAFNELRAAFVRHAKVAGLDDADTVTLKEVTEALLHCAEQIRAPE